MPFQALKNKQSACEIVVRPAGRNSPSTGNISGTQKVYSKRL